MTLAQVEHTPSTLLAVVQCRAWEIAKGHSCTRGGSTGSAVEPGGEMVHSGGPRSARGGDSSSPGARSRPHHRSGPLSSDKSRGPRFKAGAVVRGRRHSFYHGTKQQLIYTRSALCFRAEAPAAGGGKGVAGARVGRLAGCTVAPAACLPGNTQLLAPPNFPLHLPTTAASVLTRTQGGHIRSGCEACCGGPCYAQHPPPPPCCWRKCC